ncbi:hypothetical protein OB920_11970 [Halobacteria archaeon HArc-gm2]|nr:hypothetical protein [Halobacteria archaeon HArc-gm2]
MADLRVKAFLFGGPASPGISTLVTATAIRHGPADHDGDDGMASQGVKYPTALNM